MTPRVLLDRDRLDANLTRYGVLATAAGVAVRAHVKGHRSPALASRQLAAGATGIAAHAAAEAVSYVEAGATDVVIAWPWRDPWRWPRFADLAQLCRLAIHVDHADAVAGLGAAARAVGVEIGVRVEVDTGLHRVGVAPVDVVTLATLVSATSGLRLDGVTGYVGLVDAAHAQARHDLGRDGARLLTSVADAVRAAGLPCPVVAAGGTPTLRSALEVPGLTEVCLGAYALLDAGLAQLGECTPVDVALSVVTTVTGVDADGVRTDADSLLAGADQTWTPGLLMTHVDGRPVTARTVSVGDEVRVLPGHVCTVVARRPALCVSAGGEIVGDWTTQLTPDQP